jgi:Flp pilus assembly protein TadG
MVELAIVLPVLLLLVFGIIEMGRLYNAQVTLTHAAREGIRDYVIHHDRLQAENTAIIAASSNFDTTPMTFDPPVNDPCDPGQPTTMTITYPFSMRIPFIGENIVTITTKGVMRCGG